MQLKEVEWEDLEAKQRNGNMLLTKRLGKVNGTLLFVVDFWGTGVGYQLRSTIPSIETITVKDYNEGEAVATVLLDTFIRSIII